MKVNVYSLEGKVVKKVELPSQFATSMRRDLIRRAVVASRSKRRRPYGPSPMSGMMHAVQTWGKGRGVARVQRITGSRRAAQSPGAVGGRRAHPPKACKKWTKKINRKERRLARRAALAATASRDLVTSRGHIFEDKITLPVVVVDKMEEIPTTKKAVEVLEKLGVYHDVLRAKYGTHIRAGRGKMRGRVYRVPRSLLVVVSSQRGVERALRNLPGVDVVPVNRVSTEDLAPGGMPGRLTIFTQSALKEVSKWQ